MKSEAPPKEAFVVVNHYGTPCFSADTFERAAERVVALLKGDSCSGNCYRIVRVEGE